MSDSPRIHTTVVSVCIVEDVVDRKIMTKVSITPEITDARIGEIQAGTGAPLSMSESVAIHVTNAITERLKEVGKRIEDTESDEP